MLTASEDKNEFVQAMKLGTCGIVLKQSPTDLLFKSIRKVHAGEIWLDSHTTAAVMRQFASTEDTTVRRRETAASASGRHSASGSVRSWRWSRKASRTKKWREKMFISEQTVKNHLHNIFDKLGVSDRLELALYAIHKKLHLG